jgi:DNA-binding transcriptional MerR regulator
MIEKVTPQHRLTLKRTPESMLYLEGAHRMQIGKVAEQTGLTVDTIRFYERQQLLKRASRSDGGFRLFTTADIQTIRFIRRAQELSFSLGEIRELLILQNEEAGSCSHMRDLLRSKVAVVREKIAQLKALELELAVRLRTCEHQLQQSGGSHPGCCPVLAEIARNEGMDA